MAKNIFLGILLVILYTVTFLLLCYWINKRYIKVLPSYTLPLLFLVKIAYAFFFLYVYTYHYGGGELTADAGVFFKESETLYNVFYKSPYDFFQFLFGLNNDQAFINKYLESTTHWNRGELYLPNDARNVIRVNALLRFISYGEVIIHFIILSFASFMGGVDLYHWLKKKSNLPPLLLITLLTLAPSLAFWSSSLIKEPLMIFGLFIFIRGVFDDISIPRKVWRILLGTVLTITFKPYVFICLLGALIYYFVFSKFFRRQWIAVIAFGVLGIGALLITGYSEKFTYVISKQQEDFVNLRDGGLYLHADENHFYYIYYANRNHFEYENGKAKLIKPVGAYYMKSNQNQERIPTKLDEVGTTYPVYLQLHETGSKVEVTLIKYNFWQMLLNIPEAIVHSFLQPIPNKQSTWLQYPAFLENILFVFTAISTFFLFPKRLTQKEKRIAVSLCLFAAFIAMIVGWTTPVSGAIVRYIIPAHVAIIAVFAIKLDYVKLKQKLFKVKF